MQNSWRFYTLIGLLLLGMLALIIRMLDLSVFNRAFLLKQSQARILRVVDIPAYRGMITDRNGIPLAISAPVDSVWANPQIFSATPAQITQLSQLLNLTTTEIQKRTNKESKREFVYLARGMPPETAEQIKTLKIPGISFQREYHRFYPSAEVTAHILGFTNVDDNGQEGIELAYNDSLRGIPGKRQVIKDRLGQTVAALEVTRSPQEGHDLTLSIDSRIQFLAYMALQAALPKFHAESASVVVLNVKNGEILAMANVPSYNPNAHIVNDGRSRNRAVTDLFEPGSTMKAFSVANALASGKYTPNSIIDTRPGKMEISGRTITDDENFGVISLAQVLQRSSNVGAAKVTLSLPPEQLWNFLRTMGFGQRPESGFPGEPSGVLVKERIKRPIDLATLAYGYGLSVTALQLTKAYGILASHGVKRPLTFIKTTQAPEGEQVIDSKLAEQMLTLLKGVVTYEGNAIASPSHARIPGYNVGGKTGTAYISGPGGYAKNRYTSSFVGIAPLSDPQLVVAVILHDVKGNIHFGAQVSAPIFATVMGGALRYLNIPPDNLPTTQHKG